MHAVTIASFEIREPAEQLVARLEADGVPAEILGVGVLQRFWFFTRPHVAFRLNVAPEDVEAADRLFAEWHADEGALREAFRCPQCRSLRVGHLPLTRKLALPAPVIRLQTMLGLVRHEFHCRECQFTWRLLGRLGDRNVPRRQAELPKGFRPRVI